MKKDKIIFITNKIPHYRIPLYNALAEKLNIKFLITHEEEKIPNFHADYLLVKGIGKGKYKIHPEIKFILKRENPSKVVLLPPDPLHLPDNKIIYNFCRRKKIPYYVWTERWDYFHIPKKDKISNYFHKKILLRAEKIIVSGKKSKEWVLLQGVKKEKIVIAPDASEIEYDKKKCTKKSNDIIKKYGLKNKKIILYVGRLIRRKGVKYLIEAFSKVEEKNTFLLIVGGNDFYNLGEPSLKEELLNIVNKNNLGRRIIFLGEVPHDLLPAVYGLANVLVVPSITTNISEPWGLVVNEGMQFGLPVVTTDAVGSAYDLVKNGENGFMVKEKNSGALKESIEKILNNDKLRKKMGNSSKKIINEGYNYKTMAGGFLSALKD